jgi:hypothetical protein
MSRVLAGALAGAALLAAVLLLARPGENGGDPSRPAQRPAPSTEQEIRALLDRRADALERRQAGALAATARGRLRAEDRRRARRARAVRLRGVRYYAGPLVTDAGRARFTAFEAYRLAGVPGSIFAVRRRVAAEQTSAGWRLSVLSGREAQPWELATQRELRTRHFVVLAPRALDVRGAGLTAGLESARRAIRRALPARLAARYAVVVARDSADARRLATRIRGVDRLVAVADADVSERGTAERPRVVGQRLVLLWSKWRALDPAGRARVLEHELTHLALTPQTSGRVPAWLVEGIAMFVSGDRRVAEAARLVGAAVLGERRSAAERRAGRSLSLTALSDPDAIARRSGAAQGAAYAYSSAAAHYIAARYSRRRLLALYRSFLDPSVKGAAGVEATDAAVHRVLGRSLLELERDLRRWIVTRAVVDPLAP